MLIIQGSHRINGSTSATCKVLHERLGGSLIHLAKLNIDHFRYEGSTKDDFDSVIKLLIKHQEVVFATPIYWYTMSGMTKVFLDRISDLLKWNKDLGRQLRGTKMHVLSVSGHDDAPPQFTYPFKMSADYLGMHFGEYVHICPGEEGRIDAFIQNIQKSKGIH